jgi:hypothetical protein
LGLDQINNAYALDDLYNLCIASKQTTDDIFQPRLYARNIGYWNFVSEHDAERFETVVTSADPDLTIITEYNHGTGETVRQSEWKFWDVAALRYMSQIYTARLTNQLAGEDSQLLKNLPPETLQFRQLLETIAVL